MRKAAKKAARKRPSEIMSNLVVLHDSDMIAGGVGKVSRMGRLGPEAKMNVSLERCPLRGKK